MESPMTKTEQVFISYATEDTQFAHRLADDLQRLGIQVWIAPDSIKPGESWVDAIERGLEESSHMVIVLTPAALESEWVRRRRMLPSPGNAKAISR
jgi:sulfatase modifying factor 1